MFSSKDPELLGNLHDLTIVKELLNEKGLSVEELEKHLEALDEIDELDRRGNEIQEQIEERERQLVGLETEFGKSLAEQFEDLEFVVQAVVSAVLSDNEIKGRWSFLRSCLR